VTAAPATVNGTTLLADPSGALVWRERATLVVADLHLEKGSAFARRGQPLPPYDTRHTLDRLAQVLRRWQPRRVLCLGDSFHDREAADRLAPADRDRLAGLVRGHDWTWIAGNHDPAPPAALGGRVVAEHVEGALVFRHEAARGAAPGEISGHFHPKAGVSARGRRLVARCFVTDGRRMILPAFGAFAGGLDVLDPAIRSLLARRFQAFLLGPDRLYVFPRERLEPA